MQIRSYNAAEYAAVFHQPYHVFNTAAFNEMNGAAQNKPVEYLAFKTKKHKLGIIGAMDENKVFRSPFSAPFGGFSYPQKEVSLETIDESVDDLMNYLKDQHAAGLDITLPPLFYEVSFISKMSNSLYRKGFALAKNDLNYSIHLDGKKEDYVNKLHYNARKNLNIALEQSFVFEPCLSEDDKAAAYEIIKANREAKGYPLRMTYDAVTRTTAIVQADFFLVKLNEEHVAAAMVFHVSPGIVQVVYWGDLPSFAAHKTMNYLSYQVVMHYYDQGIKIIDIGPSTENSIPNYGLCDFKESIGCMVYPKYSMKYEF